MLTLLLLLGALRFTHGVPLEASNSRIIGGVNASDDYAAHMVSLVWQRNILWQICGGSLISRRLTLTAAHCVTPFVQDGHLLPTFFGRIGSKYWSSGGTEITFRSHHIHPDWDENIIKNDIAILEMSTLVELGKMISLIQMGFDRVGGNEPCWVAGWGQTGPWIGENTVNLAPTPDYLQFLNTSTLTTAQCAAGLANITIAPPHDGHVEICTFHSVGHGMCHGDSGSALVARATGKQIGIVSWGVGCARGGPDVFARISGFATQRFIRGKLYEYRN